jgi:hypothetical protein
LDHCREATPEAHAPNCRALLSLLMVRSRRQPKTLRFRSQSGFHQVQDVFPFIVGVEQLVRMQLNPDQLNNQIHRAVTTRTDIQGISRSDARRNPDLVVRYMVECQKTSTLSTNDQLGSLRPYYGTIGVSSTTDGNRDDAHRYTPALSLLTPIRAVLRAHVRPCEDYSHRTRQNFEERA